MWKQRKTDVILLPCLFVSVSKQTVVLLGRCALVYTDVVLGFGDLKNKKNSIMQNAFQRLESVQRQTAVRVAFDVKGDSYGHKSGCYGKTDYF